MSKTTIRKRIALTATTAMFAGLLSFGSIPVASAAAGDTNLTVAAQAGPNTHLLLATQNSTTGASVMPTVGIVNDQARSLGLLSHNGTTGTAQTARTRGQWLGEETHLLTTAEMPSHSHTANTGSAGSHSHTLSKEVLTYVGSGGDRYDPYPGSVWKGSAGAGLTLSTQANHQHTITAEGGGSRHSVVPPVVVLNYIIKT